MIHHFTHLHLHLALCQNKCHTHILHLIISPKTMLLIHFTTKSTTLLGLQFVHQPRSAYEIIRKEIILKEFLIIWRTLNVHTGQMPRLFVELHLFSNTPRFRNARIRHDELRKILGATSIETFFKGKLVRKKDRMSIRMWRQPNIHVLFRLFVLYGFLLGCCPCIHFHVLHHTHCLVSSQDDTTMVHVHCLLDIIVEQVGRR
mmetsp:Transcript_13944/g.33813  ORF Transcript_13944/g.33813 Transcript_13944/m.33813 type:complete len:202 (-) Transcript_13944:1459-2064(-)